LPPHVCEQSSSLRPSSSRRSQEKSMSSRFLIPALCVGAIALACGPRAHNEAAAPRNSGSKLAQSVSHSTPAIKQQGAARAAKRDAKVGVAAQLYVHATDTVVRLVLHVLNTG